MGVRTGALLRRYLAENRFSGSVPSAISALTALTQLCVPTPAFPRIGCCHCESACLGRRVTAVGCRAFFGNQLEGRLPPSLLSMRIPNGLLYVLPLGSALEPRAPGVYGCSLFPQEGCPLVRYGREGQDKVANDFGVCKAWPVRRMPFSLCRVLHATEVTKVQSNGHSCTELG
jgi:hypothetical protein